MRFIRLFLVIVLAVVLVAVAMGNRGLVTLNAFPANFDQYLGGQWSIDLPLFLVIFLAFALGMLAGLVWEYLREGHIRRAARRSSGEVRRLEAEVSELRDHHVHPRETIRDEVLALLDHPQPQAARSAGGALPAPR